MEIRNLKVQDNRLGINSIYESSWKCAYRGIIPQDYLDKIPVGQWADRIGEADRNSLVLIENGYPVGTVSFGRSRWEDYKGYREIFSIYLLPDYMGKGVWRTAAE